MMVVDPIEPPKKASSRITLEHAGFPDAEDTMRRTRRLIPVAILFALILADADAQKPAATPGAAAEAVRIRDISGALLDPFKPVGTANVIFFVQTDCPISNWYAPTIQRVCREYAARGVGCALMYEDIESGGTALDGQIRTHLEEYRYEGVAAAADRTRAVARRAKASVTPQAVVVDRSGAVRYRGRIDNAYADFGKPRQQVTSHELRDALDALLAGKPIARPETEALGCFIVDPASLRKNP
jgi:hypothetical protein